MLGGIDVVYHFRIEYLVPGYVVVASDYARFAFQLFVLLHQLHSSAHLRRLRRVKESAERVNNIYKR